MVRRILLAMLLAVISSTLVQAAPVTYYIDAVNGNDANDGASPQTAWQTFANVNGRVFNAGDSILLKSGCTWSEGMTPGGSGTPAAPITIGSYGTGPRPIINTGSATHGIFLWNQPGWIIRDLEIVGGGIDKYVGPCGIYIDASTGKMSYYRITNVVCHGHWYGISIGSYKYGRGGELMHRNVGNDQGYLDDVVIDGAECYDNMGKGIHIAGNYSGGGPPQYPRNTNIVIRNCRIHDCGGDGIVIACTDGALVENTIAHNCGLGENDRYGIWPWSSSNVTIQFCESCHNRTPQNKGGGGFDIDYDTTNCTIQYCYSHDNDGPACLIIGYGNSQPAKNAVVRYLVSQNDVKHPSNEGGAILPYGTVKDSLVYNNTIFFGTARENTAGIWGDTWGKFGSMTNTVFMNNIIYATNGAYSVMMNYSTGGCSFNNNCYYAPDGNARIKWGGTVYSTVAAFRAATGQESNGLQADPRLNAPGVAGHGRLPLTEYQLQSVSPCINAGADLGRGDARDYWGSPAPFGAFDIGAHEYQGGGGGDTQPPTAPANLAASAAGSSQIDLQWTASTDNVGVTGYQIYRGSTQIDTTTGTTYTDTGLSPNTTYSYYVKAYDAAGNVSTASNTAAATTLPESGGSTVMHAAGIWTCDANGNPQTIFAKGAYFHWRVKIVDQSGNDVPGAAVTTHVTKANGGGYDQGAVTGADGVALFSKKTNGGDPAGTWTITIVNVAKTGWIYDAGANDQTQVNLVIQ